MKILKRVIKQIISIESLIAIAACGLVIVGMTTLPTNADNACVLDVILYAVSYKSTAKIAIILSLYYFIITRNEDWTMIIIQYKSKKDIWLHNSKRIILITAFFTTCIFFISYLYGYVKCDARVNNWMSQDGMLPKSVWRKNPEVVYSSNTIEALFMSYAVLFLLICTTLFIMAAGKWLTNSRMIPLIIIVAIAINDVYANFIPILYGRFYIHNAEWLQPGVGVLISILALLFISGVLFFLGLAKCPRKEFLEKT